MKNTKKAFTLVELLTIIAIIMITALGLANLNFNTAQDKQNLELLTNTIISQIETVRTSALIGKGVLSGTILGGGAGEIVVPKAWKIEFRKPPFENTSYTGITTSYDLNNDGNWKIYEEIKLNNVNKLEAISKINCSNATPDIGENIGTIVFKGNTYTFEGDCNKNLTEISIEIKYKDNFAQTIEFNKINGLVEKR